MAAGVYRMGKKVLTGKMKELAFLRPVLNKVMGVIP